METKSVKEVVDAFMKEASREFSASDDPVALVAQLLTKTLTQDRKETIDFVLNQDSSKSINDWVQHAHKLAKEKGFWDNKKTDIECLALVITELAEAIEEIRKGLPSYYEVNGKPEGLQIELADAMLRLFDYAGWRSFDLDSAIQKKHNYNRSREYLHGKKL